MKRNPRKVRWTKAFRKAAGKEMTMDAVFEFEKRRHIPVRCDRDLIDHTLVAMNRLREVRMKREQLYYNQRMQGPRQRQRQERLHEISTHIDLVTTPAMAEKIKIKHQRILKQKHSLKKTSKLSQITMDVTSPGLSIT
jgi:large subunit ribosomal protein L24e